MYPFLLVVNLLVIQGREFTNRSEMKKLLVRAKRQHQNSFVNLDRHLLALKGKLFVVIFEKSRNITNQNKYYIALQRRKYLSLSDQIGKSLTNSSPQASSITKCAGQRTCYQPAPSYVRNRQRFHPSFFWWNVKDWQKNIPNFVLLSLYIYKYT